MADAPPRQTTRAPHSSSHSHQGRAGSFVARRGRSSSRARPYRHSTSSDDTTALARHRALAHQWSWMQLTLATWRMEDNIEIPTGIEEIPPMDLSPYTQEPTHFTVPVLAARMHRHERQLRDMDRELQETRRLWRLTAMERINQVSEEHENTVANMDILRNQLLETGNEVTQTMGTVQSQLTSSQNEISILQWRLRETETRLFEAIGNVQALEGQLREAIGMIGRLTANMERVVTLLPPSSQPPNPQQD